MKNAIKKAAAGLVALFLCLGLSACGLPGCFRERENKTTTTVFPVEQGYALRVDARVGSGHIRLEIRDGSGKLCFAEDLWDSRSLSFNVYLEETYTVTAVWEDAKGEVDVYQARQNFLFP